MIMKRKNLFLTAAFMMVLVMATSCENNDNPVSDSGNEDSNGTEFAMKVECQKNLGEWTNAEIEMTFQVASEDPAEASLKDCEPLTAEPVKVAIPGNAELIVVREGQEGDLVDYAVTSIRKFTFWSSTSLEAVTIPATVRSIGDHAFGSCTSLASITFEEGSQLETIEMAAFSYCEALTEIDIPASVKTISEKAFSHCDNLKKVTLHGSPVIQEGAFPEGTEVSYVTE